MKRFTKMAALSLATILALSGVAACNDNEGDDSSSTTTTTTTTQDAGDDDTTVDSEPGDSTDTVGTDDTAGTDDTTSEPGELYKMKILGSEGATGKFKFSERERYNIWPHFKDLLAQYGLDPEFEIVENDQYLTTIQTRMQTNTNLPEFAKVGDLGDTEIFKLADRGVILPLNELVEEHSDGTAREFFLGDGAGARSWALNTRDDGNVYFISQIQETTYGGNPGSTNIVMTIRQDWLEAVGLEAPTTAEEFQAAIQAFQDEDVNGSGNADEIVSQDFSYFGGHISEWFGLVYGLYNFTMENGTPSDFTSPWYQEGIKPYFEYLKGLNDAGLLDPSVIGSTTANQNIENNLAAAVSNYTMATWNEPAVVGAEDPRYLPIPIVQGTEGIEPVLPIEPPAMSWGRWSFTNQATNTEANAALLDVLSSEEYINLTQWGLEGETFEVDADGNRKLLPIALHNAYDEAYDAGMVIGDFLWANGNTFMKRRFVPMELEISQVPEYKAEAQVEVIDYAFTTPMGTSNYLPVATIEDTERMQQLGVDLSTRSSEAATNLILGRESIDSIDQIVAELDELGLKETVEIQQNRLNRAKEMGIFG